MQNEEKTAEERRIETERSILPRSSYIGGSSAGTILGKNPYQTRGELWYQKVHSKSLDLANNRHVMRGNLVEPIIEAYVTEKIDPTCNSEANWRKHDFGAAQRRFEERATDSQIMLMDAALSPVGGTPYIGGHPDGVGDEILWEFKTPTSYKLDRIIKEGLPDPWYLQVQHYMMISGLKQGCVAVWSWDRWEPYLVWFEADPFLHDVLRHEYETFWRHVETETPLPTDHTVPTYQRQQHEVIEDPEVDLALERYHFFKEGRYRMEDAQKGARLQFLSLPQVQGRKTVVTPNWSARVEERSRYGKTFTALTVKSTNEYEDNDE